MKFIKKYTSYHLLLLWVISLGLSSCSEYLDVPPKDKLAEEQTYLDVYDADAIITGIYGKFITLAEKHVILNELRADLLSTTVNADPYLYELQIHQVSSDNPYANPKAFYELINNCNDALKNFDIMLSENRLTENEHAQRYSDVGALRSWLYLQVGIHYGNVPYITTPIENLDDLLDTNRYPKISFDELLNELVNFTNNLPYTTSYESNSSLLIDVDGYNTGKFYINKECLLGDLNLWIGNYTQAASYYKTLMASTDDWNIYKMPFSFPNDEGIAVEYLRYRDQDARALIDTKTDGWGSMFVRDRDDLWNTEWIWSLPFDSNFAPENPFIRLFSIQEGEYQLKPSQRSINLWDSQTQLNGFPYDARGRRFSYFTVGEQPVVKKYLYGYLDLESLMPIDMFNQDGRWFLYRAAKMHLRFAEAANRDGNHKLANALLNSGIREAYTVEGAVDKTDIEQTHLPFPYDFDARNGDFPRYRATWHRNTGVRGRGYVRPVEVVGDSLISIENNLIEEAALELAFEGSRWEDLVRIARRREDPAFLANKIYDKLRAEGNAEAGAVRSKLMNEANWYLPFEWEIKED
ncbi:RagB/SusD family nutrient uptake outer membrane protein [Leeuwenhoekiella marinoflava]|uniref:Starch-binding associating with outer membrane n=2 Tax=Leeuwenhoekiella marinoflava TaxID=988 RepID=A0ABY1HXH8_9FLAO|nr:RagB/SusD family nutrient uptake outer membrane protein [Leeuwenhoekiella marinoflava]RXG27607.1 putative outer membrane starch-binding protein [Leeuwenhoekiella marinoflava]SHF66907.1 Starch-binding associating with outer membrane [Leeuwenhoekiella marinoflava DSM 3653]